MELEYKWEFADGAGPAGGAAGSLFDHPAVAPLIGEHAPYTLAMRATYYDTPSGVIRNLHGGLRLRQENDASVCCLKLSADAGYGFKQRQEFEVSAPTIREGLQALPGAGAPADVCAQLLAEGVQETCYTHFTRQATLVQWREGEASVTAELAFDQGTLGHSTASAPLREVELEYKDGSVELFHTLAARLEDNLHLVPQPLSKLARALGA